MILDTFRSRTLLGFALVALVAIGATTTVHAQPPTGDLLDELPQQHEVAVCDSSKSHEIFFGGVTVRADTVGPLSVEFGKRFTTSDGRVGIDFAVRDIQSAGKVEGLGEVSFSLDHSRGGRGSYTANQKESAYPGTQQLEFHVLVKVGGSQYHSVNRAILVSTHVEQLPPPEGTVYTLSNEVLLENPDDPEAEDVVLRPGRAAVLR